MYPCLFLCFPVQSRTQTLASCLSKTPSTAERKEFVLDLTKALVEADIPLEKAPKLAAFLKKYCKQGGSVPAPSHLRSDYLPELFPQYVEDIKRAVEGQAIYVVSDETTDACGRCVLAIILQPVGKPPLAADLVFLERVNFSTVSQAVISCLNCYNIKFSDVWAFVTDSASYMKKAFNTILHDLFPNSKHITCLAHLLNLVLEVFPDIFEDLNRVCGLVKKVFCKAPQRRLELRAYMQAQGLAPVMPVFAVLTRWGSWIEAVQYLAENLDILYDFTLTLPLSSKAVCDLRQLLEEKRDVLKAQAIFIVEHSTEILAILTKLEETSNPSAATIHGQLDNLHMLFEYGRTAGAEDWRPGTREQLRELDEEERVACSQLFQEVMAVCSARLQAVMERHPCMELLKVLPVFDPAKVAGLRKNIQDYVQAIPALTQVAAEEWHRYIHMDKSDAAEVSPVEWWAAREDRMPTLAALAALYLHLPTTSVDVERLFSHYTMLLTRYRRSLTEKNIKMMLIAKFNSSQQD